MRWEIPSKEFGSVATMAQNLFSAIPGLNLNVPETMVFSFKISHYNIYNYIANIWVTKTNAVAETPQLLLPPRSMA